MSTKTLQMLDKTLPPNPTESDNGKFLCVIDGASMWQELPYEILPITQEEYDALTTVDNKTLYIIEV